MDFFLKNGKLQKIIAIFSLAILIVLIGLPLLWGLDRVPPRVFFMGNNFSGSLLNKIEDEIEEKIDKKYKESLLLVFDGKRSEIKIKDAGLNIKSRETAENLAKSMGAGGSKVKKILIFWESLVFGFNVPPFYDFQFTELTENIKNQYKINFFESKDAELKIENGNLVVYPAVSGLGLDSLFLSAQMVELLKGGNKKNINEIEVRSIVLEPGVSTEEAKKMKDRVDDLLAYPYVFKASGYESRILRETLLSWLSFQKKQNENLEIKPQNQNFKEITNISLSGKSFLDSKNRYILSLEVDEAEIKRFLAQEVENKIFREKKDGVLAFVDGQIKEEVPSQSEINIDEEIAVQKVVEAFKGKKYFIDLPVKEVHPNLSLAKVKELGIDNLVAQGESNFAGSPTNRRHNIRVGAGKFNGVIIQKDEEFSFVTTLGPVDKSTGYLPELVIKKDKTIPEYGGGMCQVSSTAFRAAVKGGLKITERQNHAYPVQYYAPQGTDATVYIPKPDLKFVNNTPGPILIQTRMEGNLLFFDFFGNSDGRIVELEGPRVWDKKSDGSMKTEWIQKVFDKDKNLMFEKSFLSKYESPSKYPHPEDEKPPEDKKKKKKN